MFKESLFAWINETLEEKIPDNVVSFCFNLGDTDGFQIELIGSEAFEADDTDWPCEEVFASEHRMGFEIPPEVSGQHWEICLERISELLREYLSSGQPGAKLLNSYKGIGVGFVDGDLTVLKGL